jgi:hypothetical protein
VTAPDAARTTHLEGADSEIGEDPVDRMAASQVTNDESFYEDCEERRLIAAEEAIERVRALCDRQDEIAASLGAGFPSQLDVAQIRAALDPS